MTRFRFFRVLIVAALLVLPAGVLTAVPAHAAVVLQSDAGGRASTPRANSPAKREQETDEMEGYRHSAIVQKLGGMMGMSTETAATVFTALNFVILAAAVGFFLLKSLPKMFRDRSAAIQKDLVNARTVTQESSARLSAVEERLSKLDEQIAEMHRNADADLAREEQRIRATAEDEKAKIIAAAEQEIATATSLAQRDLQRYAADLAISQAARKLVVTAETDRLLVQSFAHRLGGDKREAN